MTAIDTILTGVIAVLLVVLVGFSARLGWMAASALSPTFRRAVRWLRKP